jgi:hypothetical protein
MSTNIERYMLIAPAVALADYLQNPESFEELNVAKQLI